MLSKDFVIILHHFKKSKTHIMATISQLRKEAKLAAKFVLVTESTGHFVADKTILRKLGLESNCCISCHLNHALIFSVGFDDEAMKSRAWSNSLGFNVIVKYI